MADISFGQSATTTTGFFSHLGQRLANAIDAAQRSNQHVRELERLSALSDAQLAEQGLRREDIVRHVFRDVYYL